jgi:hypothetical protein
LEAIQEARTVSAYLPKEADTNAFVHEATKLKLKQRASLGLDQVDR